MSHQHASVNSVKPGGYQRGKVPEAVIDSNILLEWKSCLLTLPEWNEKFIIVASAADDIPASTAAMEIQETFFRTKVLKFKTPAKWKRGSDESKSTMFGLDVSTYSPFFNEEKEAPIIDIDHVSGVLARLNKGITVNNEVIMHFIGEYQHEHGKAGEFQSDGHLIISAPQPGPSLRQWLKNWTNYGKTSAPPQGLFRLIQSQGKCVSQKPSQAWMRRLLRPPGGMRSKSPD
jgi:hypothetical protein